MESMWLELKLNAPGLPGRFLREHSDAYRGDDGNLQMLTVVGTSEKSAYLRQIPLPMEAQQNILLKRFNDSAVIADCALHTCLSPERLMDGPVPIHLRLHRLEGALSGSPPARIAQSLYGAVLFPLSSVVLLFADDFGGLKESARALGSWLCVSPALEICPPPRLLVVTRDVSLRADKYLDEVSIEALQALRSWHPERPYTYSEVKEMCRCRFESVRVIARLAGRESISSPSHMSSPSRPSGAASSTPQSPVMHLAEMGELRNANHCAFSSVHFQRLLQLAIANFASSPTKRLDLFQALGIGDPVTEHSRSSLQQFLKMPLGGDIDPTTIIASSLAISCYPPSAHYFSPDGVFRSFCESFIQSVETAAGVPGLLVKVRREFSRIVTQHQPGSIPLLDGHVANLKRSEVTLPGCNVCLFRPPVHCLTCQHRLCNFCVGRFVPLWPDDAQCLLDRCPLCGRENREDILAKPATAGIRALILSGDSPRDTVWFLGRLRYLLWGHLGEYFDIVVGTEKVASSIVEYFCNGKSLVECSKMLRKGPWHRNRPPKDVPIVPGSRCCVVIRNGSRVLSSYSPPREVKENIQKDTTEILETEHAAAWSSRTLLRFEHRGGAFETYDSVAGRLLASLFYIELADAPQVQRCSALCLLRLKCRLPSGPHLQKVAKTLRDRKTQLYYRSEGSWAQIELCGPKTWEPVKSGKEFIQELEIEVMSLDSSLQVQIDCPMREAQRENISNCPYKLQDILHDQGIDMFRRNNKESHIHEGLHAQQTEVPELTELCETEVRLNKEIDKLGTVLQQMRLCRT